MITKVRLIQAGVIVALAVGLVWGARNFEWKSADEALVTWTGPEETAPAPAPVPSAKEEPRPDVDASVSAEDLLAAKAPAPPVAAPEPTLAVPEPPATPKAEPPAPACEEKKAPAAEVEVGVVKTEPPPPREWPNASSKLVEPIVILLAREKQSFWGYLPNDAAVGRFLDNAKSRQQGELYALRPFIEFICDASRPGGDPVVRLRENFLDADLAKYWFTSGETRIDRSIKALQDLGAALDSRQVRLTASPQNLREILSRAAVVLAEQQRRLTDETGLLDTDNTFYHAQGSAVAVAEIIGAVQSAAPLVVEQGRLNADLKAAAAALGEAAALDPWLVMGNNADFIGMNHLGRLAASLEEAQANIAKAMSRLPETAKVPSKKK